MEFELKYTKEQEEFRKEVRDWAQANANLPPELGKWPLDEIDVTRAQFEWHKEYRRKLGHKGWLAPMMPKQYGGGGLTFEQDIIIKEELRPYRDAIVRRQAPPALYIFGTEEQKQKLLKPMLLGETDYWIVWTEPDTGVDLASVKTTAIRDGDDYVFNGVKTYISGIFEPDYMWILAVTDPDAPRHANVGQFYIPADLPGISWQRQDLINRGSQNTVFFDDVRVPKEYLIGGETQGWQVAQSSLETEHGAEGALFSRGDIADDLIEAWQKGKVHSLAQGTEAQEHLVDTLIRGKINELINRRNFWMFRTKQTQSYHGSQKQWFGREIRIRTAEDLLDLLGPHSLMTDQEWGLLDGKVEHSVRNASMATHGAGSYEIDKVIMARRIGMSRTKETAAPTQ